MERPLGLLRGEGAILVEPVLRAARVMLAGGWKTPVWPILIRRPCQSRMKRCSAPAPARPAADSCRAQIPSGHRLPILSIPPRVEFRPVHVHRPRYPALTPSSICPPCRTGASPRPRVLPSPHSGADRDSQESRQGGPGAEGAAELRLSTTKQASIAACCPL